MPTGDETLKIAIDLDGTITEYPRFFSAFTKAVVRTGCRVYIITDRLPGTEDAVAAELERYGITYHIIKITSDKASYIRNERIDVLFDDMDRYFRDLPENIAVFKVRQKYNFDFDRKLWRR